MKSLISRFLILAGLAAVLTAGNLTAQTNNLIFTAPSSFVAGEATFPAGTYTLRQFQDDLSVWEISSDSKNATAVLLTETTDVSGNSGKNELTFLKYGNTLVLKQIGIGGSTTAYIVQTSYAERKAAKAGKPTKVAVPAQKK